MPKRTLLFFLIILGICSISRAQNFTGGFMDFGCNQADCINTDTSKFSGNGPLSASDITVQLALQTLAASTVSVCMSATEAGNKDFCFVYSQVDEQLSLYVKGTQQAIWPSVSAAVPVTDVILMETGDKILMENGTDNILLES